MSHADFISTNDKLYHLLVQIITLTGHVSDAHVINQSYGPVEGSSSLILEGGDIQLSHIMAARSRKYLCSVPRRVPRNIGEALIYDRGVL